MYQVLDDGASSENTHPGTSVNWAGGATLLLVPELFEGGALGPFLWKGGRSHKETCFGCIVPRTTLVTSSIRAFKSVSSRNRAVNASSVFEASYLRR